VKLQRQAIKILPKISAFKQYYLRKQELVFYVHDTAAVKWHIPPPNSRSSFEVSAIFWDGNFDDTRVYTNV